MAKRRHRKPKGQKERLRAFWPGDAALRALKSGAVVTTIEIDGVELMMYFLLPVFLTFFSLRGTFYGIGILELHSILLKALKIFEL